MSAEVIRHFAKNNEAFAESHTPSPAFSQFPNSPAFMVVTCMDPRCNPNDFWRFGEDGGAVIRNAGGVVDEGALRSIRVLSGIMANGKNTVGAVAVVHHTDCGLLNFSNERVAALLKERAGLSGEDAAAVDKLDFGSWSDAPSIEESVKTEMKKVKADPYLPKGIEVLGFTYDVFSGKTTEVASM